MGRGGSPKPPPRDGHHGEGVPGSPRTKHRGHGIPRAGSKGRGCPLSPPPPKAGALRVPRDQLSWGGGGPQSPPGLKTTSRGSPGFPTMREQRERGPESLWGWLPWGGGVPRTRDHQEGVPQYQASCGGAAGDPKTRSYRRGVPQCPPGSGVMGRGPPKPPWDEQHGEGVLWSPARVSKGKGSPEPPPRTRYHGEGSPEPPPE